MILYRGSFYRPIESTRVIATSVPNLVKLKSLRPKFVKAAQGVYDEWKGDDDEELNGGGICDQIADTISGICNQNGIEAATMVASVGEQHIFTIVKLSDGVYSVDISPYRYETGSGFQWKKIESVKFQINDIEIDKVSSNPDDFEDYD